MVILYLKGVLRMISYKPFLHYLIDKEIDINVLNEELGISWTTIGKIKKGEPLRLDIIEKICLYFDISIDQFMEIKKDR